MRTCRVPSISCFFASLVSPDGPVMVSMDLLIRPGTAWSSAFVNTQSKVVSGRPGLIAFEIERIYSGYSSYRPRVPKLATNTPARATIPDRVALTVPHCISSGRQTNAAEADGNAQRVAG